MKKPLLILAAALAFLLPQAVRSQIVVDSLAIEEYVQDVLLGSGIQATNISYTGCLNQIGYMHEGASVGLGIDGGVVLSTDHVRNIEVPSPFLGIWNGNCAVSGDPDLLTIAQSVPPLIGQNFFVNSVNDISVLEFDFVPTGDTLRFNYIFGSDEYLEWVNTGYNDIFAFFLSGPGLTGPYDAPAGFPGGAINIAQLPGTNPAMPITISSVNNVLNEEYYIDNFNNQNISIDGYTVVLEAWSEVICGETYHIKLAIGDGNDTALESIVILEEGSFSSNAVVDVDLEINVGGPDADVIYEDCGEATLTFTRAAVSDLAVEDMVIVTWTGTATMGADYDMMPDTIIFPVGVASVSFEVDAFEDGLPEGLETVHMDILNLAACNGSGLVSNFEFFINDEPEPLVVEGYTTEICQGDTITLEPIITGGYGNFIFDWSTGDDTETVDVWPDMTTDYFLTVSDTCGMPSDDAEFTVNILVFPPLTIQIDNGDITLNCNEQVTVTATAGGGDGMYTYYWYDEAGNNLWGWGNTLWYGSWNGEGEINVEVTDGCGFTETDMVNVELNVPDLIVDVPATVNAPCNQLFTITADVSGGQAPYWYSWYTDGFYEWDEWDNVYDNTTDGPMTVEVIVGDNCGQQVPMTIEVTVDSPPIELTLVDELTGTCQTVFSLDPEINGGSGGFVYAWTEGNASVGSTETINFQSDVNTTVNLTVTDACGATASDAVNITIDNPALSVDLGADVYASCIDMTELIANLSGGSGGNSFEWVVNGSVESTGSVFEIQSYETVDVTVNVEDACGMDATDVVTIFIPDVPLTISAVADTAICVNGAVSLWAIAEGGEGGFTYNWQGLGINSSEAIVEGITNDNDYTVVATDICGESISWTVNVDVMPIEAGFVAVETSPNNYEFTAMTEPTCDNCDYFWDFGDGASSTEAFAVHTFDGLGSYTVTHIAVNEIGCTDINYYTVTAPPSVYIPNTFTPNNDGINDVFFVVANSVKEYELYIFNRWGEEVFYSTDPGQPWIGDYKNGLQSYAPDGVYSYVLKVKGYNSDAFEKQGNINLIR